MSYEFDCFSIGKEERMKNRIIALEQEFGVDQVRSQARDYLIRMCGFDLSRAEHRKLLEEAEQVGIRWLPKVRLSAVLSSYPKTVIEGERAMVEGIPVSCQAFGYFPQEKIRQVYVYLMALSVDLAESGWVERDQVENGQMKNDKVAETLLTSFYQDAWGTGMIDGGRDLLREWISSREGISGGEDEAVVSDSFGPGYYGMELEQVDSFFSILEGERIGARLLHRGVISPPKACAGFYLVLEPGSQLPPGDCRSCIGNPNGCCFCRNWAGNAGENSV